MRIEVSLTGDLASLMETEVRAVEQAVTTGVVATARELQADWRGQIGKAGLGQRLANSIRLRRYPRAGASASAAAVVNAASPKIVEAFDRGALIRSKDGFYLAIPTPAAGLTGLAAGGKRQRITPGAWERRTGMRLRYVWRPGRPALLVADDARLNTRGLAAPKRGKRRRDGTLTGAQTVVIFILLPQVRLRKRLDLDRATKAAEARLPQAILAAFGNI